MSHHEHSHDKGHHHEHRPGKKRIHPAWWIVVAAVLALAGMFLYNASLEEALQPGGQITDEVPADAE
jgi:hypothetical protein